MPTTDNRDRSVLQRIARRVMLEKGLDPDFPPGALSELDKLQAQKLSVEPKCRDLRSLPWCSIDNDDSLDLDQLTIAKMLGDGCIMACVAIANVDALVRKNSALDEHARYNTTSVYTVAETFPMLPEKLSNDLTSLNLEQDRPAVIIEMSFAASGVLKDSCVYEALVRNHAKLTYNKVSAWLTGAEPIPQEVSAVKGLEDAIRLQDQIAQKLKKLRHEAGALELQTIEARPVFQGDKLERLQAQEQNRAQDIIEDFMIAANGVTARFLAAQNFPSIRRVVRVPKRWDRIRALAVERGCNLPSEPDSKALDKFLLAQQAADPLTFPDLSLSVIKLLGAGEYIVEMPGDKAVGHFGLAVKDYTHSTAPNRRFPDLITQRMIKAAVAGSPLPYSKEELSTLARHCTDQEDAAKKVERQVVKSAAALLLRNRIGESFDAIVTGASDKGIWVRLVNPPVEGKLVSGFSGLDIGSKVRVRLERTDVMRGFIDFKAGSAKQEQRQKQQWNKQQWRKPRKKNRRKR
ncbi:MAG: RNB domain-containing ribonuclease [Elusimicrobiota bacterium]